MPTMNRGKIRQWLKDGKVKVVRRTPFTVRLTQELQSEETQPVTVGLDAGYATAAVSAVSPTKELFSAEFKLRTDIPNKMTARRQYRRTRRNNNTRYRKPRFLNRKGNDLAPSVKQKVLSHVKTIEIVKKLLPVTESRIEGSAFDIQKINNPDIAGKEYQQGSKLGYRNVHAYVLARDNHTCFFNKKACDPKLQVHHIIERSNGGTDKPDNLITLCKTCHEKVHGGDLKLPYVKHKQFKGAVMMNVLRSRLFKLIPDAVEVYGYETKARRYELGIEKSHCADAFVVAGGTSQERVSPYLVKFKRRNNRQLQQNRKGQAPAVRKHRYCYQSGDKLTHKGSTFMCRGVQNKGKYVRLSDGVSSKDKVVKIDTLSILTYGGGMVWS